MNEWMKESKEKEHKNNTECYFQLICLFIYLIINNNTNEIKKEHIQYVKVFLCRGFFHLIIILYMCF